MANAGDELPPRSEAGPQEGKGRFETGEGKVHVLDPHGWQSEEEAARRKERLEEGRHERSIQKWVVLLAIFTVLVIYLFCMYEILFGVPADKVWAWPLAAVIVTSLCSGLAGYAIGRTRRRSGN